MKYYKLIIYWFKYKNWLKIKQILKNKVTCFTSSFQKKYLNLINKI